MKVPRKPAAKVPGAYFDCNSTTRVLPEAAQASLEAMQSLYGNPSSPHQLGIRSRHILESTRKLAAQTVGAQPDQIAFTSGATESIQTAVFSALQFWKKNPDLPSQPTIIYSSTEHKAVIEALFHWVSSLDLDFEILEAPVDSYGHVQLDILKPKLPSCILLCTMAVNNETGVIQRIDEIEKLLVEQKSKALWLVDCVQALGKLKLQLNSTRIDYAAFSGHKIYAPKGTGFLYFKKQETLFPLSVGGGQEKKNRAGTQNIPGIVGLGAVLGALNQTEQQSPFQKSETLFNFRKQLLETLVESFPDLELNTPLDHSVPTTLNFSVPGLRSGELVDVFDAAGLSVSAGSACSSASPDPSHVLVAMGFPNWRTTSAIRLSFGPLTTQEEVDLACDLIKRCASSLFNSSLIEAKSSLFSNQEPKIEFEGLIHLRLNSTNTWLLINDGAKECIIIDPAEHFFERIQRIVRGMKLKIIAILDTHDHADHHTVRPDLNTALASHALLEGAEFDPLGWPTHSSRTTSVTLANGEPAEALLIRQDKKVATVLARVSTPGHTRESTTYLFGRNKEGHPLQVQYAFCGDLILSGGLGRSDFGTGSTRDLFRSLKLLREVTQENTLLCSAHDYNNSFVTTLERELADNEILNFAIRGKNDAELDRIVERKDQMDRQLKLGHQGAQGVLCGVTPLLLMDRHLSQIIEIAALKSFLRQSDENPVQIIDVREPQEYQLCERWRNLGVKVQPKNIPISRLVHFMSETLMMKAKRPRILFVCRSGNRSFQASQAFRRLGYSSAWSLEGGLALVSE